MEGDFSKMCRLMGFVSHEKTTFPHMAGEGFGQFVALSSTHCDGWGVATIDHNESEAHLVRAAEMAHTSKQFDSAIADTTADGGLLHLRWATQGLPVSENNAHPFVYKDFTFIHNGSIKPPVGLERFIDAGLRKLIAGDTDSERYFYLLITMIEQFGFEEGVKRGVKLIKERFYFSSINAMIMNESTLITISENHPDRRPDFGGPDYYELKYRTDANGVLIASTGWPQDGWVSIPNHTMLVVDRKSFATRVIALPNSGLLLRWFWRWRRRWSR
ncbi:MAG: class II glutamine amidotransferase [Actinomycetota bacterium]